MKVDLTGQAASTDLAPPPIGIFKQRRRYFGFSNNFASNDSTAFRSTISDLANSLPAEALSPCGPGDFKLYLWDSRQDSRTFGQSFMGRCFVRQWVAEEVGQLVNLDKLTYAGNLDSLVAAGDDNPHVAGRVS